MRPFSALACTVAMLCLTLMAIDVAHQRHVGAATPALAWGKGDVATLESAVARAYRRARLAEDDLGALVRFQVVTTVADEDDAVLCFAEHERGLELHQVHRLDRALDQHVVVTPGVQAKILGEALARLRSP